MFDPNKIRNIIKDIPPNGLNGYIAQEDFKKFHEKHAFVISPFKFLGKTNKFKSDDLMIKYKYKLSYENNPDKIKVKILDIFQKHSGFKGIMHSDLRYIEDLRLD